MLAALHAQARWRITCHVDDPGWNETSDGTSSTSDGTSSTSDGTSTRGSLPAEPWMRGTWGELDPLRRGVMHALEMCEQDVERWAMPLRGWPMSASPAGLPPVAFHLRHTARSLDRLLTYA